MLLLDQAVGPPAVRWMEVSDRHIGLRMNRVETRVSIRQLHEIIVYGVFILVTGRPLFTSKYSVYCFM